MEGVSSIPPVSDGGTGIMAVLGLSNTFTDITTATGINESTEVQTLGVIRIQL